MALRRGNAHSGGDNSSTRRDLTLVTDDLKSERLTPALWRQLHNAGYSNTEIAELTGRSQSAVSHMLNYHDVERPQTKAQKMWPWAVSNDHLHAAACEHLRRHVAWMTDGRTGMARHRRVRLRNFYTMLRREKCVVEFDPALPPEKGVSHCGGWTYRDRVPADEDLIIRINTLIVPEVDDEFREFWSIPDEPEWPKLVGKYD